MKTPCVNFCCILLLLLSGCSEDKKAKAAGSLHFNWGTPRHFGVMETILKNNTEIKIEHDCLLTSTNGGFVLEWLNSNIVQFNGQKPSEELRQALKPVEASFNYPSFRIDGEGNFIEVIDADEYVQKANHMLDEVVSNRPEDAHKSFSEFGKSKSGRQMVNQIFARIWQTWVEAWLDVDLADGGSICTTNQVPFIGGAVVPAIVKASNLGPISADPDEVSLKYEQDLSATNFSAAMNNYIDDLAKETELKSAGPLTNQASMRRITTLEAQSERQTLRPHWAKVTIETIMFIDGDQTNMLESYEYQFNWDSKEPLSSRQQ